MFISKVQLNLTTNAVNNRTVGSASARRRWTRVFHFMLEWLKRQRSAEDSSVDACDEAIRICMCWAERRKITMRDGIAKVCDRDQCSRPPRSLSRRSQPRNTADTIAGIISISACPLSKQAMCSKFAEILSTDLRVYSCQICIKILLVRRKPRNLDDVYRISVAR